MPEGLLKRDLQGFRERVADDGDAVSVRRLLQGVFAVAQARTVDADVSRALFAKPARRVWAQHPAHLVFKGIEVRVRVADNAQGSFGDKQREDEAQEDEEQFCGPAFSSDHVVGSKIKSEPSAIAGGSSCVTTTRPLPQAVLTYVQNRV